MVFQEGTTVDKCTTLIHVPEYSTDWESGHIHHGMRKTPRSTNPRGLLSGDRPGDGAGDPPARINPLLGKCGDRSILSTREQATENTCVPEGMTGIEPASPAWKAGVLATIRHSHGAKDET